MNHLLSAGTRCDTFADAPARGARTYRARRDALAWIVMIAVGVAMPAPGWGCSSGDIEQAPVSAQAQRWKQLSDAGEEAYASKDLTKAQQLFDQALTEATRQHLEEERARTLSDLGQVYRDRKDYTIAETALKESLAIRERLAPNSPCTGVTLDNLGELYEDEGKLDLALATLLRALDVAQAGGPDNPHLAVVLNNLGAFYYTRNKTAEAEPYLKRALDGYRKNRAAARPKDRGEAVEAALREVNEGREPHPEDAKIAELNQALLTIYRTQHNYDRFRALYVQFLTDKPGFGSATAVVSAHNFSAQAEKLVSEKKYDDAEAMYNRALATYEAAGLLNDADAVATNAKYAAFKKRTQAAQAKS